MSVGAPEDVAASAATPQADPSALTDEQTIPATPEAEAQPSEVPQPETEPEYIDIPDPDRPEQLYTRVRKDHLPEVWIAKEREVRQARQAAIAAQMETDRIRQEAMHAANPPPDFRAQRIAALIPAAAQKYPDASQEQLRSYVEDRVDQEIQMAGIAFQANQQAMQTMRLQQFEQDYQDIRTKDPSFDVSVDGGLARTIQAAYPNEGPRQHYQRFLKLSGRGNGNGTIPPAVESVLAQAQNQRARAMATPGMGSSATALNATTNPAIESAVRSANEFQFNGKGTAEQLNAIRLSLIEMGKGQAAAHLAGTRS